VFVVDNDKKVEKRMVTAGASHQQQWIINKGSEKGEHVIVEGLQNVRPGMEVKVAAAAAHKPAS